MDILRIFGVVRNLDKSVTKRKMNIKSLIFFSAFVVFSCGKKRDLITKPDTNNYWDELIIETRFQKLTISKFSDSAEFENIIFSKEVYNIPPKYEIEKTELQKLFFTKAEKDSLSKFIYQTITTPKFTNRLATGYVGNVKLSYKKENMNLTCEYKSVGDWTEVSQNTHKIFTIINSKIPISRQ